MPKKEVVTETTETTEIANLPAAEPAIAVAADPVPVSDAVTEVAAPSPETTDATETTETTAPTPLTADDLPTGPALIECVTLHGRLTHEGKTYAPHERVSLPVDLALGLIASGHVAKVE